MKKKKKERKKIEVQIEAFNFAPEEYLDKSLLFDLKKTSEEKSLIQSMKKYWTLTRIILNIEKVPNTFRIRKDRDQPEKKSNNRDHLKY